MPIRLDRHQPRRALAVYAHPDDPEVSCGGTLARWARDGASVHLVLVNRGEKGSDDPAVDPEVLATARAREVADAAAVLGVEEVYRLDVPDGESHNDLELRRRLVTIMRDFKPDVVVCPDPEALYFGDGWINHRDHRVCGFAVLDAVAPACGNPHYFPEAGKPHRVGLVYLSGTLEPDTAVEIGDVLGVKAEALARHRTQLGGVGEWVHELVAERAIEAGRALGVGHAETFRVLRLG
jgi:LmbE family N-acetylglucosaminyl deacetylase